MIGLFAYAGLRVERITIPQPSEALANYFLKSNSPNLILFGLSGAKTVGAPLFGSMVGSLKESRKDLQFMLQQMIDEHPLQQSRKRMRHIFENLFANLDC